MKRTLGALLLAAAVGACSAVSAQSPVTTMATNVETREIDFGDGVSWFISLPAGVLEDQREYGIHSRFSGIDNYDYAIIEVDITSTSVPIVRYHDQQNVVSEIHSFVVPGPGNLTVLFEVTVMVGEGHKEATFVWEFQARHATSEATLFWVNPDQIVWMEHDYAAGIERARLSDGTNVKRNMTEVEQLHGAHDSEHQGHHVATNLWQYDGQIVGG